jgi:hypothetical protein
VPQCPIAAGWCSLFTEGHVGIGWFQLRPTDAAAMATEHIKAIGSYQLCMEWNGLGYFQQLLREPNFQCVTERILVE